jgi:hypothetical protein
MGAWEDPGKEKDREINPDLPMSPCPYVPMPLFDIVLPESEIESAIEP